MLGKVVGFITDVAKYAYRNVRNFVVGTFKHAESIAILTTSALGINALVGEAPFVYAMPMWIEAPMVIPVMSVIAVLLLLRSAEWRAKRRGVMVFE